MSALNTVHAFLDAAAIKDWDEALKYISPGVRVP